MMYKNNWDTFTYWRAQLGFVAAYYFIKDLRDQWLEWRKHNESEK